MRPSSPEPQAASGETATGVGRYRWVMLALVFFATTINYMDRTVLTVLAPTLQYRIFHWSDADYAVITMAFQAAYAVGLLTMGMVLDRLGTRLGYTVSIVTWGIFDMLHAAVRPAFSRLGFPLIRFGFGLGQAGTYPAAVKAVAEWFPRRERALATGIFNAGSNMGGILAPIFVPLFLSADGSGWQWVFLCMGGLSLGCALLWWNLYRRPDACTGLSDTERAYISSDVAADPNEGRKVTWRRILRFRQAWAFAACKTTDVAWWFYSFWVGKFFFDQFGLTVKTLAVPLMIIFISADVGSVGGGWLSSSLLKRGWSLNRARKTTLLLCALCALPVGLATRLGTSFSVDPSACRAAGASGASLESLTGQTFSSARSFLAAVEAKVGPTERARLEPTLLETSRSDRRYWIAVIVIALAAAAHQGWSATIFTIVSDVFPKRATGSVVGFGGMMGSLAGISANLFLGRALTASGAAGYSLMFVAAGASYLVVLGIVQVLMPTIAPVEVE